MSLARTALRGAARAPAAAAPAARRNASSVAHDEHHDEHHEEDSTVYPPEGFTSRGWLYTIAGAAGVAAFYKYAPAPGSDNALQAWIAARATRAAELEAMSDAHLALSAGSQDGLLVTQGARRPSVYRIRHPQIIGSASPFGVAVGSEVDMSGIRTKVDRAM